MSSLPGGVKKNYKNNMFIIVFRQWDERSVIGGLQITWDDGTQDSLGRKQ